MGRITRAGAQTFAFDPAHNLLDPTAQQPVSGNRLQRYNGHSYYYDDYGNTVQHETADGSQHNLYYDLYDRLEKAEVFRRNESGGWDKQTWVYQYDALNRRIRKGRLKEDGGLEDETRFVWDGSRLLQEVYANGSYTYVYADQDSYEPLAQIHNYTNAGFETYQEINYFHCDQIGIPREMTDKDGRLLWFGDYDGWGRLDSETNITGAHQPFRLQNQYCDAETGLHYNFFRYYDPNSGRFINQDPIGLWGGDNFYWFAPNSSAWIDVLGLASIFEKLKITTSDGFLFKGFTVKAPFNIPVQRFGDLHLNSSRGDFWGLRIGTNKFINRTFAAILPSWNPLTNYNSGVIPKGTKMKVGIIGPQGLKYLGGSLQFIVHSEEVKKVKSKKIKRKGKC